MKFDSLKGFDYYQSPSCHGSRDEIRRRSRESIEIVQYIRKETEIRFRLGRICRIDQDREDERERTVDLQRCVRKDRRADSTVVYRLTEKRVAGPRDDRRTARLEGRRRSRGWPDEGESENEVARRERKSERERERERELVGEREEEGRKALARAVCRSLEEAATRERRRGRRGGCVASSVASVRGRTRRQGEEGRRAVGGREGRASPQPMRGASGRARDSTPPSVVMATGETREKLAREFALVGGRSVSGVVLVGSRSLVGPKNSRIEAVVEYHLSSPPPACAGTSALVDLQAHAQLIDWVARARARSFSSFSL